MSHLYVRHFCINQEFPEEKLISQVALALDFGGIIAFPTGSNYGLGCGILNTSAIRRIYRLKNLASTHLMSIICADFSDIARYALMDNGEYEILKRCLPGDYTFVLRATSEVPKVFQSDRETVGIRVPANPITLAIARAYRKPIVSSSTRIGDKVLNDVQSIIEHFGSGIDLVAEGGFMSGEKSTIIDLSGPKPRVLRKGLGCINWLSL